MNAADEYLKEAERCDRLAETCRRKATRAFFMDAATRWRQKALEATMTDRRGPTRESFVGAPKAPFARIG
jgi:hypothetical protein